jgi:hypothetical protein
MQNQLEMVRDVVVIVTGIAGIAAGIITGIFAWYKYKKSREAEAVLQLEFDLNVHCFQAKNLIDVTIQVKNTGKAAAYVSPMGTKKALLMIRKVTCPDNAQLVWEQFENQKLINDVEYMNMYDAYAPEDDMIYEPASIDTYKVFFSTDYFGPVWLRAQLIDKKDYAWIVDRLFILPKP